MLKTNLIGPLVYYWLFVSDSCIISAICNPECVNGGICTAPDTCDCSAAAGYAGIDCNSSKYDTFCTFKHTVKETLNDSRFGLLFDNYGFY